MRVSSLCEGTAASGIVGSTLEDFAQMLVSKGVDVAAFGKGHAKTLQEFHREVTGMRRSYLVETADGLLERRLELVRISLVVGSSADGVSPRSPFCLPSKNGDKTLMVVMDVMEDGRARQRNQKLAIVVEEGSSWEQAVRSRFARFSIAEEAQRELLALEMCWYKEELSHSPSIPGIPTKYLTHEVRMRVVDPERAELKPLGLPAMAPFSTTEDVGGRVKKKSWAWVSKGEEASNEEVLTRLLADHKVNVAEFEDGALVQLLEEVERKTSQLVVQDQEIVRDLQIVKVWVEAEVLSVPHFLVVSKKTQRGKADESMLDRPISMRMACGQGWQDAARLALQKRLGLDDQFLQRAVLFDSGMYRMQEEMDYSKSFPGLKTRYTVHEVTCRLREQPRTLGLPHGLDFAFSRIERGPAPPPGVEPADDVVVTHFAWKQAKDIQVLSKQKFERTLYDRPKRTIPNGQPNQQQEVDPKRKVEAPRPLLATAVLAPAAVRRAGADEAPLAVQTLLGGQQTDWARARNAARRIRDQDYHCGLFFADCRAAFPELQLYIAGEATSGRAPDDEYQRTVGALFAFYWLMRLRGGDGAVAFCFGVRDDWRPLGEKSQKPRRSEEEIKKRVAFLEQVDWTLFINILKSAGFLTDDGDEHDEERTLGMLALTAFHDIMKVKGLAPRVKASLGQWAGYQAGEEIGDHDLALGYVLEFHPEALPSFAGLPAAQRESVRFTQGRMDFNMGWLVQGEAPPGALFRTFRSVIEAGGASSRDVDFYFVHWLTDLAGAEPCPVEGCEKFVLKFPQKVLLAFMNSFHFVCRLDCQTETQVLEQYLDWRWRELEAELGAAPTGTGSIAQMRLVVMAQSAQEHFIEAYWALAEADRRVLNTELSRTGCADQAFKRDGLQGCSPESGPAVLVYYGPALLQKNSADPCGALRVLAEVLRQARELWPLRAAAGDETVTVRIDALKDLPVSGMKVKKACEFWALQRLSSRDGQVVRLSIVTGDGSPAGIDWSTHRLLAIGGQEPAGRSSAFPFCGSTPLRLSAASLVELYKATEISI